MIKRISEKVRMGFIFLVIFAILYGTIWAFVNRTVGPVIAPGQGLIIRNNPGGSLDSIHVKGGNGIVVYEDSIHALVDTSSIAANGVGYINLRTGCVTSTKILDGTIATADIAALNITGNLVAVYTLDSSKITNTVTKGFRVANTAPSWKTGYFNMRAGSNITITMEDSTATTNGGWCFAISSSTGGSQFYGMNTPGGTVITDTVTYLNDYGLTVRQNINATKKDTIAFKLDSATVYNAVRQIISDSLHVSTPHYPVAFVPAIGQYMQDSISIIYAIGNDTIPGYLWQVNIGGGTLQDDKNDSLYYEYRILPGNYGVIDSMTMNLKTSSTTNNISSIVYKIFQKHCTAPCSPDLIVPSVDIHASTMQYSSTVAGQWVHKSVTSGFGTIYPNDIIIVKSAAWLDWGQFAGSDAPILWIKGR